MDSRGVLAWICEYGDGLYGWIPVVYLHGFASTVMGCMYRWTPVSLHGLAVVCLAAWICRVEYLLGFGNGFTFSKYRMLRIVYTPASAIPYLQPHSFD